MSDEKSTENEKSTEIYYDHYKDTFTYLRAYLASRDKTFYITLGLLVLIFFQANNPDVSKKISVVLINKNIGDGIFININFINSLLLFVFLSLIIKYFQLTLLIERQYTYIHALEDELTSRLTVNISREGKSYEEHHPFVSWIIHRVYRIILPILLIIVLLNKFNTERMFFKNEWRNGYFLFDSFILLFIFLLTIAYFSWTQFGDFKKSGKSKETSVLEAPEVVEAPRVLDEPNSD